MGKWSIEMAYGIGFTVTGIEADTKEKAIEVAKTYVEDEVSIISTACDVYVDAGDLEFKDVTFVDCK